MEAHLLPKLRCQFAEFLSQSSLTHLGILFLPTCVGLRYGRHDAPRAAFLGSMDTTSWCARGRVLIPSRRMNARLWLSPPTRSAYRVEPESDDRMVCPSSSLLASTHHAGAGMFACLPSTTPLRPRLRSRLTLGGRAWPRKPWVFGERDSHSLYRYSCLHLHFHALQPSSSVDLRRTWNAPLPLKKIFSPWLRYSA